MKNDDREETDLIYEKYFKQPNNRKFYQQRRRRGDIYGARERYKRLDNNYFHIFIEF